MKQAMEYKISGLKCDTNGCDYRDDAICLEDYLQYLNKPCPKCGGNLLTEADLKATQAMIAACDWINALGLPTTDEPCPMIRMHMDGSGIPVPEIMETATNSSKGGQS